MDQMNCNINIIELITRRRRQILVHSFVYYNLDDNFISDSKWAEWANELYALQQSYPEEAQEAELNEEFKDFDPSTGYNLAQYDYDWVKRCVDSLYLFRNRNNV